MANANGYTAPEVRLTRMSYISLGLGLAILGSIVGAMVYVNGALEKQRDNFRNEFVTKDVFDARIGAMAGQLSDISSAITEARMLQRDDSRSLAEMKGQFAVLQEQMKRVLEGRARDDR